MGPSDPGPLSLGATQVDDLFLRQQSTCGRISRSLSGMSARSASSPQRVLAERPSVPKWPC